MTPLLRTTHLLLCFALLTSMMSGQAAHSLVADINGGTGSSDPSNLVALGSKLIFAADDGITGQQLWATDGTDAGTYRVKTINPDGGAQISSLTKVGSSIYFSAFDPVHGQELWQTDGSDAGTRLVKDIRSGSGGSGPYGLTNVGGVLYFAADDSVSGFELWKSDGTEAGTVQVKDINNSGSTGSYPQHLTSSGGMLLFTANAGASGIELWKSDGSSGGTAMVADINPSGNSSPDELTDLNGTLFFLATDGSHGFELWKSNGTGAGTSMVVDINTGGSSSPSGLTVWNNTIIFSADDGSSGTELWKSDGTAGGTVQIKDIRAGGSSYPSNFTAAESNLFFVCDDGTHGFELWKTDGTTAGTALVKDINPAGDASPDELISVAGVLCFRADDGIGGLQLWGSNGSQSGTALLATIDPGGDSYPANLTQLGSTLFCVAGTEAEGRELWEVLISAPARFRTFTAAQLAVSTEAKPVKLPKKGKTPTMPNTANVIDAVLKARGTILVGIPGLKDSLNKELCSLQPKSQADVFKSLYAKGNIDTGRARGFDYDLKKKVLHKKLKSISPSTQNNRLKANLLALKINIIASEFGKTQTGFGSLIYYEPTGNPLSGLSIDSIGRYGDDAMTNWKGKDSAYYQNLDTVVAKINAAFAGTFDTTSWTGSQGLLVKGVRTAAEVSFLVAASASGAANARSMTGSSNVPAEFHLDQNYPNPFNPSTVIRYALPTASTVTLSVYSILGQEVARLVTPQLQTAGEHTVNFDAAQLASGVYFYKISVSAEHAASYSSVRKMMVLR